VVAAVVSVVVWRDVVPEVAIPIGLCHSGKDREGAMATMNVSVPDPMRDWVQSRIDSGRYASVSDYVRDLIRKDQMAAGDQDQWLASLDAALERAVADAEAGRVTSADAVFDRLQTKYETKAAAQTDAL
jgi:antitoxin ParD1/3/4